MIANLTHQRCNKPNDAVITMNHYFNIEDFNSFFQPFSLPLLPVASKNATANFQAVSFLFLRGVGANA